MTKYEVEFQKAIATAKSALTEVSTTRDRESFKIALSAMSRALSFLNVGEDLNEI